MLYANYVIPILCIASITFSASFAENEQVTIPLGASDPTTPFSLSPSVLDIQVNDTVQWKNNDGAIHTVTTGTPHLGFDGRIDSGLLSPGETFSYKFDKVGVYGYYCLFHPWMTGLVNVDEGKPIQPVIGISISANNTNYNFGDIISISGQVSRFVPNGQVTLWVTDPEGRVITVNHIETENGNTFSTNIDTSGDLWTPGDTYKVYAQYGSKSSVAYTTVQLEPNSTSTDEGIQNVQNSSNIVVAAPGQLLPTYMLLHKESSPDSSDYLSVQTDHLIYNPNDQVKIYGSIWNGLFQQLGGAAYLETKPVRTVDGSNTATVLVTVKVKDNTGVTISNKEAQVDTNGNYLVSINLPQDAHGRYSIETKIETKVGLLNTLDASTTAKLASSAVFVVAAPSEFSIPTNLGGFNVGISSNSSVSNFEFKPEDKKISFVVQGDTGTSGVTSVIIPKPILSGQLQVLIDGNIQPYNSDNVIVTSDTDSETTLEINYHHSTHTIELVGTQAAEVPPNSQAIPEFRSIAPVILVVSIISTIVISSRIKRPHQ